MENYLNYINFSPQNLLMELDQLKRAHWRQKKKEADLELDGKTVIRIEFGGKKSTARIGKRELEIRKIGFWHPEVVISEGDQVLLIQKHMGFWGNKNVVEIGDRAYDVRSEAGMLYNIGYFTPENDRVLAYHLTTLKWKAGVTFTIDNADIPKEDLLLLFILGYFTIKNVIQENLPSDGMVAASD